MGNCAMTSSNTIYFGYGSNMWKEQMSIRCPDSEYIGIGRQNGYKWIINERGYANVVFTGSETDFVYGLVYTLTPEDEKNLDRNEGVPQGYGKEILKVDFWRSKHHEKVDVGGKPEEWKMLVYINRELVHDDKPKEEYIYRMNMGIRDALASGIPQSYVDTVLRKFIPDRQEDKSTQQKAEQQAQQFKDPQLNIG